MTLARIAALTATLIGFAISSTSLAQPAGRGRQEIPEGAPEVLRKAIKVAPKARYQGKRLIEFHHGDETMRHEEFITRDGSRLRIEFPPGSPLAGQIIVENGGERRHYLPDKNEIYVQPPRREEVLGRMLRLIKGGGGRRLVMRQEEGDLVAGVATQQVVVSDSSGNVLQRIYIEPKSGVVLRRRLYDPVGTQVGYFTFERIDLNPPKFDASLFRIERRGATIVTPYDILRKLAKESGLAPVFLPKSSGFRLDFVRLDKIAGQQMLLQVYASNEARVSLFQSATPVDPDRLRMFARREFRVRSWQSGGRSFVLVGGVDDATLARLARVLGEGTTP